MRIVGSFQDPRQALAFSQFLGKHEIAHQVELIQNSDWGSTEYGTRRCEIWVHEEEQWPEALKWYQAFVANPSDPLFEFDPHHVSGPVPPPKSHVDWNKLPIGWITRGILLLCCALFFSNMLFPPPAETTGQMPFILSTSPIEKELLYDYPKAYEILNRLVDTYGLKSLSDPNTLPPAGQALVKEFSQTPYWQGFYTILEKKEVSLDANAPLFEKIRQGQVWRLFTPALLHGSLLHIFLNMLWLIALGKQIEEHLGPWRYIFFIIVTAIFSNTAQYFMSGANFIGFSGVLCAMLTFILARQHTAPQERYQLERPTIIFMLIYIGGMAVIQLFSFFLEAFAEISIPTGIANTAHLAGAVIGFVLGKLQYFSERPYT